ncbi:MAG TPA: GNAT family N-acetyltransferase [Moraxellaceae bacterium]|nr:GNAT family N-acetyltransferase [Moraxellaceae bacterium]
MPPRTWRRISRLADLPDPDVFYDSGNPFVTPAFLLALEDSGAVGAGTTWTPCHLLFLDGEQPAALLPLYRKSDSRGEYVFDHGWAAAYRRHGLAYYPKLVTAVPFTPVPGPRLLLARGARAADWIPFVLDAIRCECDTQSVSGWHGLFVEEEWLAPAQHLGFAQRQGCRFHWSNPGYSSFDDFLAALTSKKRKDIRRERRLLTEAGVRCEVRTGRSITKDDWDFFHACYAQTYFEHGQTPYLNREFFTAIARTLPEQTSLVIASDGNGPMASALFFHQGDSLFGRYWGCLRRATALHFEVCYYQGIELCLRLGLRDFDPGTQGEHKVLRGFAPRPTYSLHWVREPAFQSAIEDFVREEAREMERYRQAADDALPYRRHDQD